MGKEWKPVQESLGRAATGIGKKSAQQIILDLQGKVDFSMNNISSAPTAVNNYLSDAMLALEALGYSKKELAKIEKKLSAFDFSGVDEYVKQGCCR